MLLLKPKNIRAMGSERPFQVVGLYPRVPGPRAGTLCSCWGCDTGAHVHGYFRECKESHRGTPISP